MQLLHRVHYFSGRRIQQEMVYLHEDPKLHISYGQCIWSAHRTVILYEDPSRALHSPYVMWNPMSALHMALPSNMYNLCHTCEE